MKKLLLLAALSFCVAQISGPRARLQTQVSVPVEVSGFVFDFRAPFEQVTVDVGKNLFDTSEQLEVRITPNTVFLTNKNKPMDKAQVRIGLNIEIKGEKLNNVITAQSIKSKVDLDKDESVKGYFEGLDKLPDGEVAWISGQTVRLGPGVVVKGDKEWKGRSFNSFNEMMLGSRVEVKGRRQQNGLLIAREGTTKPNVFDKDDKKMRDLVQKEFVGKFSVPPAGQSKGKIPDLVKSEDGKKTELKSRDTEFVANDTLTNHTGGNLTASSGNLHSHAEGETAGIDAHFEAPAGDEKNWLARAGKREIRVQSLPAYVAAVGNRLVPQYLRDMPDNDPGKLNFRFYVVREDSFNAFSLPDGTIVVHTGLLRSLQNESQLAAILGHEIAHVTHEHSRREVERKIKLQNIAFIAGMVGGRDAGLLAQLIGGLVALEYSRDLEDESDRVGLFYMANAGYDPREGPKIWRRLVEAQGKQSQSKTFFAATHSRPEDRLKNLNRELVRNYAGKDFSRADTGTEPYLVNAGLFFGWATISAPPKAVNNPKLLNQPAPANPKPSPVVKPKKKP
jgi:hypothetical protein